jgi:hypothetical protein
MIANEKPDQLNLHLAGLAPLFLLLTVVPAIVSAQAAEPAADLPFITAHGDKLYEGDEELRFISFNIPNLHYVEDDMRFEQDLPFRWPTEYEIRDALETVRQMGGRVVRPYALSVKKANDPKGMPRHVLAPGEFDEEAFEVLDVVLAVAREKNIRLVIPLVDNWWWWGGIKEYAAFRGKDGKAFWKDRQLIGDFKKTIRFVVERVNSRTGIAYKNDPTILAWETGNELASPHRWTREIAAYIKQLDTNHLVLDGRQEEVLQRESINNPYIDLLQTHHYEKDPRRMIAHIVKSARKARGKKPYHVGEFGFLTTAGMTSVMDTIMRERGVGGVAWSLRYHNQDGGFYWHHEPSGGDLFKAYHWPGFTSGAAYDETSFLAEMRRRAFAIRGLPEPAIEIPRAPELIEVTEGGLLTWRGSAGASGYDIERVEGDNTGWQTIARGVSDAAVQYRPLFSDQTATPARSYRYRVRARNHAGLSDSSPPFGPVTITHRTFVDELQTASKMLLIEGSLAFRSSQARKYKEDAHGLEGRRDSAVIYHTNDPIIGGRVYLFADQAGDHLRFRVSKEGEQFRTYKPTLETVPAGDVATYGYRQPFIYRLKDLPEGIRYLRIAFQGSNARLTRVELEY